MFRKLFVALLCLTGMTTAHAQTEIQCPMIELEEGLGFDAITEVSEDIFGVRDNDYKWQFYGVTSKPVSLKKWKFPRNDTPLFNGGVLPVQDDNDRWYLLRSTGTTTPLPASYSVVSTFKDGLAMVKDNEWQLFYIDTTGKKVFPHLKPQEVMKPDVAPLRSDRRLYLDKETYRYGYIDSKGKIVIKPQYEEAHDFTDGFALVNKQRYPASWQVIDVTGRVISTIPEEMEIKGDFVGGHAVAYVNGKHCIVDTKLNIVATVRQFATGFYRDGGTATTAIGLIDDPEHPVLINIRGEKVSEAFITYKREIGTSKPDVVFCHPHSLDQWEDTGYSIIGYSGNDKGAILHYTGIVGRFDFLHVQPISMQRSGYGTALWFDVTTKQHQLDSSDYHVRKSKNMLITSNIGQAIWLKTKGQ